MLSRQRSFFLTSRRASLSKKSILKIQKKVKRINRIAKRKLPSFFSRPAHGEKRPSFRSVFPTNRFFSVASAFSSPSPCGFLQALPFPASARLFFALYAPAFSASRFQAFPAGVSRPGRASIFYPPRFFAASPSLFRRPPSPLSPPKNAPFCVLGKDIKRAARRSFFAVLFAKFSRKTEFTQISFKLLTFFAEYSIL